VSDGDVPAKATADERSVAPIPHWSDEPSIERAKIHPATRTLPVSAGRGTSVLAIVPVTRLTGAA